MVWSIAHNATFCPLSSSPPCTPSMLTFLAFVSNYLAHSCDEELIENKHNQDDTYDFIIVGAGTAGCVVGNRLTEIEDWKVLLLEAGNEEPAVAQIPALIPLLIRSNIDYGYRTEPEPCVCSTDPNNSCYWASGKVVGGSSTINSMQYVRGNRYDYDHWASLGNPGWSWNDVLPYFKKSQDLKNPERLSKINPHYHKAGGYMSVEGTKYDKVSHIVLDAWKELGLREIDYNTGKQLGTGRMLYYTKNGARYSSNAAFLRTIRGKRPNLTVRTNVEVVKIIFDKTGSRAIGVEYFDQVSKSLKRVSARKEVILSAGTMISPKLLMLSGIGPAKDLEEIGIKVVKDLPVGQNLQNHVSIGPLSVKIKDKPYVPVNYEDVQNEVINWLNSHQGTMSQLNFVDNIAYYKSPYEPQPGVPDININFVKNLGNKSNSFSDSRFSITTNYNGFQINVQLLTARSRGVIKLNKTDPIWSKPLIYANYLTEPTDLLALIAGVRFSSKLLNTTVFRDNSFEGIRTPAKNCEHLEYDTFEYYECFAKSYSTSIHHIVGTCKMGPANDKSSVVDSRLRVHGIKGLRVIDASIMPLVTRSNTQAPTIMIGEKGSDMIKQDWNEIQ